MKTLDEIKQEFGEKLVEISEMYFNTIWDTFDEILDHDDCTDEDVNEIMAMIMNILNFKMNECIQERIA